MSKEIKTEVCLVNMPLAGITRPSLALGLLKSLLKSEGIETNVCYPNLWYVEFIGPGLYGKLLGPRTEECLVDWLFAPAAFAELKKDDSEFLGMLTTNHPEFSPENSPTALDDLIRIRSQTADFIDWTAQRILAMEPKIVGCTSTFQQHVSSIALLRRIRELAPEITTVMGGANCETHMGKTTHKAFPWVDFVISGEADDVVAPLFRQILDHGRDLPQAASLPLHIFAPHHREHGYPATSSGDGLARGTTNQLAALPLPDYDDYFYREVPDFVFQKHLICGIPYESSRGCWWGERSHCTFCGLNGGGMGFRSKSSEQVLDEIDALVTRYGPKRIETVDNIIDMSYFDSVLPRLAEQETRLDIFYETKSNLKKSQIEAFRNAGVRWIQPGIESMSSEVLKLIGKGVKEYQNLQTLKWCRQFGIRVYWNIIAGFPGEQDSWYEAIAELLPKIEHLQPANFSQLRFDRYSPYFNQQDHFGLQLRPCRQYEFVYPLASEDLEQQVYFFTDDQQGLAPKIRGDGFPGVTSVFHQVTNWRNSWPQIPRLEWDPDKDLRIIDERKCATQDSHSLTRDHRRVLDACDSAIAPKELARIASTLDGGQPLEALVEDLLTRHLLTKADGRLFSLVLDAPEPFPRPEDFPGGSFRVPQSQRRDSAQPQQGEQVSPHEALT